MDGKFRKTAAQCEALALLGGPARYVLLFGGSRSGKTFILVYALLVRALRAPGSRHAILRFRANGVRQAIRLDTLPKVVRLAFPGLKFRENCSDGFLRLPNQSEIWLGGLDSAERADRILGREFATIYFNECSEIDYGAVNTALTRLAQRTALRNRAYFDCNPAGKSHWSYRLFVEKRDPVTNLPLAHPENYASMLMNPDSNRANLPEGYIEETLAGLSERQRQRFQFGAWLDDLAGALWSRAVIDCARTPLPPAHELERIVVGVDPAVTANRTSDATGIVTAARGLDGRFYVLSDASCVGTPAEWARRAVDEYRRWKADRMVGEVNNGGDLIETVVHSIDPDVSFRGVRAVRGKGARAEPVAALYEQRRVSHTGIFPELEEEMTTFVPGTVSGSPDRVDALVWAITTLLERGGERFILS